MLYYEGDEALDQVAQRSCGCLLPDSVQDQAGWRFEQPGLVEGVPAHGRWDGNQSLWSLPTQAILRFYDSLGFVCFSTWFSAQLPAIHVSERAVPSWMGWEPQSMVTLCLGWKSKVSSQLSQAHSMLGPPLPPQGSQCVISHSKWLQSYAVHW